MNAAVLRWGRALLGTQGRDLVRSSGLVFAVGMFGNVANYLYQFAMGRLLSLSDFGALNAILSLTIIISVPAATVTLVKAKYISRMVRRDAWGEIRTLYYQVLKRTAFFAGAAAAAVVIFCLPVQRFLNLERAWPVLLFAVLVFSTLLVALNTGFFQGLQRFVVYSSLGAGNALLRLVTAVALVWAGAALGGALSAAIVAGALIFILSLVLIRRLLIPYRAESSHAPASLKLLSTAATLFFLTSIMFVDMVLVKHLFSPEEAGVYAGVCVLGRTILYLPGAITQVLLPKASGADREESFQLLISSALMTAGISLAGVLLFYTYPGPLLRLLLGGKYHGGADLLGLYGLAMLFFAVMTLLVNFCLARDIQDAYRILAVIFCFQVAGLYFLGRDGFTLFLSCMILTGLTACVLLFWKIRSGTRAFAISSGSGHHPG